MTSFKQRRESILNVFAKAKEDLEQLNREIDMEIEAKSNTIACAHIAIEELEAMKSDNQTSIKSFKKLLKL